MRLFLHLNRTLLAVFLDALAFIHLCLRPTAAVAAENLFLRKQLGLFLERKVTTPRERFHPIHSRPTVPLV